MKKYTFYIALSLVSVPYFLNCSTQTLQNSDELLVALEKNNLWQPTNPLKLHLGCGETHFSGYINIDFPPAEHTVQTRRTADIFADITQLHIPANAINEIRSHHLFEHFDRALALALLCKWHEWLKIGGKIVIETPDFDASIRVMLDTHYSYKEKQITLRHIFGSHEAHWAIHCDGWYDEKFRHVCTKLGFSLTSATKNAWNVLVPNIIITATKIQDIPNEQLYARAKELLRESMVNNGDHSMWLVWCHNFDDAINKMA